LKEAAHCSGAFENRIFIFGSSSIARWASSSSRAVVAAVLGLEVDFFTWPEVARNLPRLKSKQIELLGVGFFVDDQFRLLPPQRTMLLGNRSEFVALLAQASEGIEYFELFRR